MLEASSSERVGLHVQHFRGTAVARFVDDQREAFTFRKYLTSGASLFKLQFGFDSLEAFVIDQNESHVHQNPIRDAHRRSSSTLLA